MRSLRFARNLILALAAALLSTGSVAALEEEWNQRDAAEQANILHQQVQNLIATAKVEDRAHGLSPKSSENYLLIQDLMQLKRHTARLKTRLSNGASREETQPVFNRIARIVTAVARSGRSSSLLSGAQPEIDKASDAFAELSAYYGVEPTPAPDPIGGTPPVSAPAEGDE